MSEPISAARLNELLTKMYQRRIIRALYNDPTLPWLPESYWREDFERKVAADAAKLLSIPDLVAEAKLQRELEDNRRASVSVDDLMAEWDDELPKLQGDSPVLEAAGWGRNRMYTQWGTNGTLKAPTEGDQQPSYDFECYQCGRPITGEYDRWKDHAGKTLCDLTFVDQIDIDTDSYWRTHQPKPWHGEEEDDDQ